MRAMRGEAKKSIIAILLIALLLGVGGCKWKAEETVAMEKGGKNTTTIDDKKDKSSETSEEQPTKKPDEKPIDKPDENKDKDNNDPLNENPDKNDDAAPVSSVDVSTLNKERRGWSWLYSPTEAKNVLDKYQGYANGDTSKKYLYLTFDEGYENGYTESILDTLKANDVKAAFFITGAYVEGSYKGKKNVELLKRIASEGHIIGNHSVNHKSMPSLHDEEEFKKEILGVEEALKKALPEVKMSKYFRPPMGDFSELSLYYTQKLGYKSIFFSFAYLDYDVNNQPDPEKTKQMVLEKTKPGSIVLLHPQSKTNAEILDSLIKEWKARGYEFKTLDELPEKGM